MAGLISRYTGTGLTVNEIVDLIALNNAWNYDVAVGSPAFATGGDALLFNTTAAGVPYVYAIVPYAAWPGEQFAVALYFRLDQVQNTSFCHLFYEGMFSVYDTLITEGLHLWAPVALDNSVTSLHAKLNNIEYQAAINITKGDDHLLVVQRSLAGLFEVYLDDLTTPVITVAGTSYSFWGDGFWFGKKPGYGGNYDGVMGDIRIFDAPLTLQERQDLTDPGLWALGDIPVPPIIPLPWPTGCSWHVTLTGENDNLDDIDIPATSITARLRSDRESYLSIVAPWTADVAQVISDRPNGTLRLKYRENYSDEEETRNYTVVEVPVQFIQDSMGAHNRSIILSGRILETYADPSEHDIAGATLQQGTSAAVATAPVFYRWQCPGDTVTVSGKTFVVDTLSLSVSVSGGVIVTYSEAG